MGPITIIKLPHCPVVIQSSAVLSMNLGDTERINFWKKLIFGNAENWTWGRWVISANAMPGLIVFYLANFQSAGKRPPLNKNWLNWRLNWWLLDWVATSLTFVPIFFAGQRFWTHDFKISVPKGKGKWFSPRQGLPPTSSRKAAVIPLSPIA